MPSDRPYWLMRGTTDLHFFFFFLIQKPKDSTLGRADYCEPTYFEPQRKHISD